MARALMSAIASDASAFPCYVRDLGLAGTGPKAFNMRHKTAAFFGACASLSLLK
jgi:hypothetical protein